MAKTKGAGTRSTRKRRGKGEDMTGAKEGAVETRKAGIGDNSGELALPEPERYEYHKKQIFGYLDQKESANSRYRNALKSAQKDGINTNKLLEARNLVRANDPKKALSEFKQLAMFLKLEGYPIELIAQDVLLSNTLADAEKKGYADCKAGRSSQNAYPQGSDMHMRYARGYHRGTCENAGLEGEEIQRSLRDAGFPDDAALEDGGADEDGNGDVGTQDASSDKEWNEAAPETAAVH